MSSFGSTMLHQSTSSLIFSHISKADPDPLSDRLFLNDVSGFVHGGEMVGILGSSGSGKTSKWRPPWISINLEKNYITQLN